MNLDPVIGEKVKFEETLLEHPRLCNMSNLLPFYCLTKTQSEICKCDYLRKVLGAR